MIVKILLAILHFSFYINFAFITFHFENKCKMLQ